MLYAFVAFVATLALVWTGTVLSNRRLWPVWVDLAIQITVIGGIAAIIWIGHSDTFQPNALYRHVFVAITAIISAALIFAAAAGKILFREFRAGENNLDMCLERTELFAGPGGARTVTFIDVVRSLITLPARSPLELLLPPAIFGLLLPPEWLKLGVSVALGASFVALLFSGLNDRFGTMWNRAQSGFFRGGALVVSVLVIAFATARFAHFSYVETVLDTAAGQVIAFLVAAAYVLSWWYDYWTGRLLAQEVLLVIDDGAGNRACVPYPICAAKTHVPADARVLQIHGSSRFVVVRPRDFTVSAAAAVPGSPTVVATEGERSPKSDPNWHWYFQTYSLTGLIDTLALSGAPGGRARPAPERVRQRVSDYKRLVGGFAVVLAVLIGLLIHRGEQLPQLEAGASGNAKFSLADLVFDPAHIDQNRPMILIAASGGGTRAALFTAAVLEGLAAKDVAGDVVLGSGISGGGAALAYFAGHRLELVQVDRDRREKAWDDFFTTMRQPFIQDVLEQATEWRMATGGRLGFLLRDSFEHRWALPTNRQTLGSINDLGLILNTSLAGRFYTSDLPDSARGMKLIDAERKYRADYSRSDVAGGRLILTNLKLATGFTNEALEHRGGRALPIVIDDPNVRLECAAALNANFPPVFSNAAVDVGGDSRYWVTDGGVIDNRGMEMMLYALRQALATGPDGRRPKRLPRIHVIVADASAFSEGFSQDRGVGPATSGGSQFAGQLAAELVRGIEAKYSEYGQSGDFRFWYLMMPDELRTSTSFGTHWMLQPSITIAHRTFPHERKTLTGQDTIELIRALFTGADRQRTNDAKTVLSWLRETPSPWNTGLAEALQHHDAPQH
jgi:hypothetical protein